MPKYKLSAEERAEKAARKEKLRELMSEPVQNLLKMKRIKARENI